MKITNVADTKKGLESLEDDIVMGIDSENHLTLLNSLTYLYSNPVLAAFREYCANASDAHKDAGQTKPFEATFPVIHNRQNNLRIRDYGNGMNRKQIEKVFSQYGATTKANNNAQVGGFGLGSKSGLSVSNHLFVNTVSNGVLIKAQVLKNTGNTAVIRILSEEPTKLPSGTEILLPLTNKQLQELREHAEEQLVGYRPEQVILNHRAITYSVHEKDLFIPVTVGSNVVAYIARNDMVTRNVYSVTDYTAKIRTNYSIIMGGVYYPTLPSFGSLNLSKPDIVNLFEKLDKRFRNAPKVIINVPVGSVDLPPHRDSIIDTEKTWDALTGLFQNLNMGLETSIQSYLNAKSVKDASKVVASMSALFAPDKTWKHKGTLYNNEIAKVMGDTPPVLYNHVSGYGAPATRLDSLVGSNDYTTLHLRVPTLDYAYNQSYYPKNIITVNLVADKDKYDELVAYEANTRAHYSVRQTLKKPRLTAFITRYVRSVVQYTHDTNQFFVVVSPVGGPAFPAHFKVFDMTLTEEEFKAQYKAIFPPAPKKAVTQQHCRVTKDKLEYSKITTDEKVIYFGGKSCYGTEEFINEQSNKYSTGPVVMIKNISAGNVERTDEYPWVQEGLLRIIPNGTSLVAVGNTRSASLFKKAFADAETLGAIVMDFYDNLDYDRRLAVRHAFSLFARWIEGTESLFALLAGKDLPVKNASIYLMFREPELISVAYYLYAFKDSYVEGLVEWKKKFFAEVMTEELASQLLLPVQSLLDDIYLSDMKNIKQTGTIPSRMKVYGDRSLEVKQLVSFIDKLTAE